MRIRLRQQPALDHIAQHSFSSSAVCPHRNRHLWSSASDPSVSSDLAVLGQKRHARGNCITRSE
jgi:hypothetical protein